MRICVECGTKPVGREIICSRCGAAFVLEILPVAGERVRERRKGMGLSMRDVARYVGVSPQTIARVELRNFAMSEDRIVSLAHRLGLCPDQLVLDFGKCPSDAIPQTIEEVDAIRAMRGDSFLKGW